MIEDPYSPRVREFFARPVHSGGLQDGFDVSVDSQGVRICLAASLAEGTIRRLRFRAWGCPHVIAAAEAICTNFEGRPIGDLEGFSASQLMQSLPVPLEKTGRILVLEDAVQLLGQELRNAVRD